MALLHSQTRRHMIIYNVVWGFRFIAHISYEKYLNVNLWPLKRVEKKTVTKLYISVFGMTIMLFMITDV